MCSEKVPMCGISKWGMPCIAKGSECSQIVPFWMTVGKCGVSSRIRQWWVWLAKWWVCIAKWWVYIELLYI
jgi:hypothetical protein